MMDDYVSPKPVAQIVIHDGYRLPNIIITYLVQFPAL